MGIGDYIKIACVVLILLLVCAVLWLWRLKDNSEAALVAAQTVHVTDVAIHKEDQATITALTTYNTKNDALMAKFVTEMSGIDLSFGKLNTAIATLRRTDPNVEKFLSTPIPPALLCLLQPDNGVCNKAATPAAK